jgi:hypothetical protein
MIRYMCTYMCKCISKYVYIHDSVQSHTCGGGMLCASTYVYICTYTYIIVSVACDCEKGCGAVIQKAMSNKLWSSSAQTYVNSHIDTYIHTDELHEL